MSAKELNVQKHLEISDLDKFWGFYLTDFGYQVASELETTAAIRFKLEHHQVRFVFKGSGTFKSSCNTQEQYGAGSIFLLYPGERYQFKPESDGAYEEYWLNFDGNHVHEIINSGAFSKSNPIFKVGINDEFLSFFKSVIDYAEAGKIGYQQVSSGIIRNMLGLLYYRTQNSKCSDDEMKEKMDMARILIRESITESKTPVQIAEQLGLGYSCFRKAFKKYVGTSPAQFQIQMRMQQAKEILISTNKTVSEIAYELSFDSPSQFSTFFRIRTNLTPLEFRKTNRSAWLPEWNLQIAPTDIVRNNVHPMKQYG